MVLRDWPPMVLHFTEDRAGLNVAIQSWRVDGYRTSYIPSILARSLDNSMTGIVTTLVCSRKLLCRMELSDKVSLGEGEAGVGGSGTGRGHMMGEGGLKACKGTWSCGFKKGSRSSTFLLLGSFTLLCI